MRSFRSRLLAGCRPAGGRGWVLAALFAAASMVAAAAGAQLKIERIDIAASVQVFYNEFGKPRVGETLADLQFSEPPFHVFQSRISSDPDGVAQVFYARPGLVLDRHLYAAALQQSIANAVATQTVYIGGDTVSLTAAAEWSVQVKNHGTEPVPVDFSFYISGGGLDAWCTACVTGGLTLTAEAWVLRGSFYDLGVSTVLWKSITQLDAMSSAADLRNGFAAGSVDTLGIGFSGAAIVDFPDEADPYYHATIDPFNATAHLFDLDPGFEKTISYRLIARASGSSSAFGSAWLVDPFSLDGSPTGMASSQFAINGVPIAALVPEPAQWLLMLCGLLAASALAPGHGGRARWRSWLIRRSIPKE